MKLSKFSFGNKDIIVRSEKIGNKIWAHVDGQTIVVDVELKKSKSKKSKGASSSGDRIEAPMPGKVTKVILVSGSQVKKGDSVIAMEAMKMEYTLKAEADGVVKLINCQIGDQVNLGQCLVEIDVKVTTG